MELLCNIVSKVGRCSSNNIFVTLSDRLYPKKHIYIFIVTRHQFTFSVNIALTPQSIIISTYTIRFKQNMFDIHRAFVEALNKYINPYKKVTNFTLYHQSHYL